jgi:hypothetical protein
LLASMSANRLGIPLGQRRCSFETPLGSAPRFAEYLPHWTNEDGSGFHWACGEVVSAVARRAVPYGVTLKLATKTDHGEIHFHLIGARANLVTDHPELIGAIRTQLRGKPVAVVLDTLNRSLQGSESDDKDMTAYVKSADAIREAFGCAVIIVHHCGVEGSRPRGHTSLTGQLTLRSQSGAMQPATYSPPSSS